MEVQNEIRVNLEKAQLDCNTRNYSRRHNLNVEFQIVDIVFMKRNPVATGGSTKLQKSYSGPLVVVELELRDIYRVEKLNNCRDRSCETTVHVSQLKIWSGNQIGDSVSVSEEELENEGKNVFSAEYENLEVRNKSENNFENLNKGEDYLKKH